jgi:hypothetical protein
VRLQKEYEIQAVGGKQDDRGPEVHELFLTDGALGRKETIERARDAEADRRDQHHRAVEPGHAGVVFLHVVPKAAEKECGTHGEHQVGENRADDRRAHHVEEAGPERYERDDQFRGIAEGRVEQATDGVARARRELLGREHDQSRNREDRQRCREEEYRRGNMRVFEADSTGMKASS